MSIFDNFEQIIINLNLLIGEVWKLVLFQSDFQDSSLIVLIWSIVVYFIGIFLAFYVLKVIIEGILKFFFNPITILFFIFIIGLFIWTVIHLNNNFINLIDVKYNQNSAFQKISSKSKNYIKKSFNIAFKIIKLGLGNNLVNGPISKKKFLNKKFLGITEYISDNFSSKNNAMLIFNKNLSVCPLTTHLPIKLVSKNINKELIIQKVKLINTFYKNYLNSVTTPMRGLDAIWTLPHHSLNQQ